MSWKDLPRSGFDQLPTKRPDEAKKGYVTGTQVMDRLIAACWGPDALQEDDAANINARILECARLLVSAAENERIEGFVEWGAEMRPLQPNDWDKRTPREWADVLLDSEIPSGSSAATSWAPGKILMFEREPVAEWIDEVPRAWAKHPPKFTSEWPPLPEKFPVSPAERDQVFTEGVRWWRVHGIAPTAPEREEWVQQALKLPNRKRAREYLKERKQLMPDEWTKPGRRKNS